MTYVRDSKYLPNQIKTQQNKENDISEKNLDLASLRVVCWGQNSKYYYDYRG